MFLMLHSTNWPNFIVWLSNMCVVNINFPVYGVINFEINLSFLIQPFSYMTKKARTQIEISWEEKEVFKVE